VASVSSPPSSSWRWSCRDVRAHRPAPGSAPSPVLGAGGIGLTGSHETTAWRWASLRSSLAELMVNQGVGGVDSRACSSFIPASPKPDAGV
jgi:hypothetical protein